MLVTLLPLVWLAADGVLPPAPATPSPQAELAGALADANSVDWVRADPEHRAVRFGIDRAGEAYEVIATVRADGTLASVTVHDAGRGTTGLGPLSWLVDVMRETAAVTQLSVDADGEVTLVTDDGLRYLAIPGRDGSHNDAVEARWGAAWNGA
ncbi:MAG TPA: hypothetical protein VLX92_17620 [Kofleriaceae bacterium]|nr:hypothetical protein [Kofleriaceae bacterium]